MLYLSVIFGILLASLVNAYFEFDSNRIKLSFKSFLKNTFWSRKGLFIAVAMVVLSLLIYQKYSLTISFLKYTVLIALLLTIGIVDIKSRKIPNNLVLIGLMTGLIFSPITEPRTAIFKVLAGFVAALILLLISWMSKGGVGMGDVKLMGVIGIYLGLGVTLSTLVLSVIIGGIAATAMLLAKKAERKGTMPFAPYILLGTVIMILLG